MGLGMKSTTGSDKFCKNLNKFHHVMSFLEEQGIKAELEELSRKSIRQLHAISTGIGSPFWLYRWQGIIMMSWRWTDSSTVGPHATHDWMNAMYQNKMPGRECSTSELCSNRWQRYMTCTKTEARDLCKPEQTLGTYIATIYTWCILNGWAKYHLLETRLHMSLFTDYCLHQSAEGITIQQE